MILFSQTREDPQVELKAIEYLKKDNIDIFLIGSGGCTLLSLLSSVDKLRNIDVLDKNREQLYLIQLKMSLYYELEMSEMFLPFIEGRLNERFMWAILNNLKLLDKECKQFWMRNINLIYEGINKIGTYEKLFRELVDSNFDYEKVFDRQKLANLFGFQAVNNTLKCQFSDHFEGVMDVYKLLYQYSNENYFYNQIMKGEYEGDMPLYLQNINRKNDAHVYYINDDLLNYMGYYNKKYDIIQTSNVTDWLDERDVVLLLKLLYKNLNKNGLIIMRKLNSDINLNDLIKRSGMFSIIDSTIIDKSYFYKEVIIAQKVSCYDYF